MDKQHLLYFFVSQNFCSKESEETMSEEIQFRNPVKEMRSVVDMDEVKEFVRITQNMESKHDQIANDLENAAESKYLDSRTRSEMLEASEKERRLARKWNALWAVFSKAEFHEVKY